MPAALARVVRGSAQHLGEDLRDEVRMARLHVCEDRAGCVVEHSAGSVRRTTPAVRTTSTRTRPEHPPHRRDHALVTRDAHSPPAADRAGFLLEVELPVWNNDIGRVPDRDAFLRAEGQRVQDAYGNHPSFAMPAARAAAHRHRLRLRRLHPRFHRPDDRARDRPVGGEPGLLRRLRARRRSARRAPPWRDATFEGRDADRAWMSFSMCVSLPFLPSDAETGHTTRSRRRRRIGMIASRQAKPSCWSMSD